MTYIIELAIKRSCSSLSERSFENSQCLIDAYFLTLKSFPLTGVQISNMVRYLVKTQNLESITGIKELERKLMSLLDEQPRKFPRTISMQPNLDIIAARETVYKRGGHPCHVDIDELRKLHRKYLP